MPGNSGNARGFTLIELIVALVVMACAAGLIVPNISRSMSRQDLHEAGQHLMLTARTARELAIARRQPLVLQVDLDRGGYSVSQRGRDGAYQPVQTTWLKAARWPESIRGQVRGAAGVVAEAGVQPISFNADGSSSGASIKLMSEGREYVVVIRAASGKTLAGDPQDVDAVQDQYDLGE
jgi:type II secretion system protein H